MCHSLLSSLNLDTWLLHYNLTLVFIFVFLSVFVHTYTCIRCYRHAINIPQPSFEPSGFSCPLSLVHLAQSAPYGLAFKNIFTSGWQYALFSNILFLCLNSSALITRRLEYKVLRICTLSSKWSCRHSFFKRMCWQSSGFCQFFCVNYAKICWYCFVPQTLFVLILYLRLHHSSTPMQQTWPMHVVMIYLC